MDSASQLQAARSGFLRSPGINSAQTYLRTMVAVLAELGRQQQHEPAAHLQREARRAARPADLLRLVDTAWAVLRSLARSEAQGASRLARILTSALPDERRLKQVLAALTEPYLPGTELWVDAGSYHHAGVYVGNGKVVNVTRVKNLLSDFVRGKYIVRVRKEGLRDFTEGRKVSRGPSPHIHPPEVAVQRALSKVGNGWRYDPLNNNCQHFSSWVVSNKKLSPEGRQIKQVFSKAIEGLRGGAEKLGAGVSKAGKAAGSKLSSAARAGKRRLKKLF